MIVGAGVVSAFQIGKAPIALPDIRLDLGLGLVAAGWVLSMFNLIGVAVGAAVGMLTRRVGDRRMILAGLTLLAAASLAGSTADSAAPLLAARFVEGMGFLMVVVAAPALIVRVAAARELKLAFGGWGTYMPVGQATMLLVSPLILLPFGWRGLWVANAILVAGFAAGLALATRHLPRPAAPAGPPGHLLRDLRDTLAAPGPPVLALTFTSYTLSYFVVMGFLPVVMIEDEGITRTSAALLTAFAIALNAIGNLAAGALLHRGVPRWVPVAAASAAMAGCTIGIYADALPFALRYGFILVFSGMGGMLPATVLGAAAAFAPKPHLAPTVNGLLVQGSNLGQAFGPPAIAALAVAVGNWRWSPLVLVAAGVVGVALALVLRALERRRDE
ncbi:MAG: MFS transporter [Rhodospirillales bacterium]|nr:MFS transporter [Rhodospirillales bacterium]